jgi:hypothetical protein
MSILVGLYCGEIEFWPCEMNPSEEEYDPELLAPQHQPIALWNTQIFGEPFLFNFNERTVIRMKTGEVHKITEVKNYSISFEPFKF